MKISDSFLVNMLQRFLTHPLSLKGGYDIKPFFACLHKIRFHIFIEENINFNYCVEGSGMQDFCRIARVANLHLELL